MDEETAHAIRTLKQLMDLFPQILCGTGGGRMFFCRVHIDGVRSETAWSNSWEEAIFQANRIVSEKLAPANEATNKK